MLKLKDFKSDLVVFYTPMITGAIKVIMFYDLRSGIISHPIGKGDSVMEISYNGYKHRIIFDLSDKLPDNYSATQFQSVIDRCVEEFYRRVILNNYDGDIIPEKQFHGTDVDRCVPLNQLKRDGFHTVVRYNF
jgi:hypothetical protein